MEERLYRAFWDDGHDYGSFTFYSRHRANSKANKADAYARYRTLQGYRRAQAITITRTSMEEN